MLFIGKKAIRRIIYETCYCERRRKRYFIANRRAAPYRTAPHRTAPPFRLVCVSVNMSVLLAICWLRTESKAKQNWYRFVIEWQSLVNLYRANIVTLISIFSTKKLSKESFDFSKGISSNLLHLQLSIGLGKTTNKHRSTKNQAILQLFFEIFSCIFFWLRSINV